MIKTTLVLLNVKKKRKNFIKIGKVQLSVLVTLLNVVQKAVVQ